MCTSPNANDEADVLKNSGKEEPKSLAHEDDGEAEETTKEPVILENGVVNGFKQDSINGIMNDLVSTDEYSVS